MRRLKLLEKMSKCSMRAQTTKMKFKRSQLKKQQKRRSLTTVQVDKHSKCTLITLTRRNKSVGKMSEGNLLR